MFRISDAELDELLDEILNLPMLDLSLHAQLPELAAPALESLCQAVANDDPDAAASPFAEVLEAVDTPLERARIARAIIGLRATGRLDRELAAAALIDLASGSRELISAALLEAVAVRGGAVSTPAGILLAA